MLNKTVLYFTFFFWLFSSISAYGQVDYLVGHDIEKGEELYKANCTACHRIGDYKSARLIGPGLNEDIFNKYSEQWLIDWIRNSSALIESGDEQAVAIFEEFNQSVMTAFPTFSDEDIKDILAYIEKPPVEEVAVVETIDVEVAQDQPANTLSIGLGQGAAPARGHSGERPGGTG